MTPHHPSLPLRLAARALRTRWLVRAPIWLYRARLGFLFGSRLLMLEHVGRVSGQKRYVVLEIVDHTERTYVVAAGFGERAQWLMNLDVHPRARISTGTRVSIPVTATRLRSEEAREVLVRYNANHPRSWAKLKPIFEQTLGGGIGEAGTTLPMVRLSC